MGIVFPYASKDASYESTRCDDHTPVIHGIHRRTYDDDTMALRYSERAHCISRHTLYRQDVYGIRIYQGSRTLVLRAETICTRTHRCRVLSRRDPGSLCSPLMVSLVLYRQKIPDKFSGIFLSSICLLLYFCEFGDYLAKNEPNKTLCKAFRFYRHNFRENFECTHIKMSIKPIKVWERTKKAAPKGDNIEQRWNYGIIISCTVYTTLFSSSILLTFIKSFSVRSVGTSPPTAQVCILKNAPGEIFKTTYRTFSGLLGIFTIQFCIESPKNIDFPSQVTRYTDSVRACEVTYHIIQKYDKSTKNLIIYSSTIILFAKIR